MELNWKEEPHWTISENPNDYVYDLVMWGFRSDGQVFRVFGKLSGLEVMRYGERAKSRSLEQLKIKLDSYLDSRCICRSPPNNIACGIHGKSRETAC
jgi:hypothetical protein